MMVTTLIVQAIPVAVMPVLSRLYAPSDFGFVGTVFALAILLSIVSTLRLEVAIVVARDEGEASALMVYAMVSCIAICAVVALLAVLLGNPGGGVVLLAAVLGALIGVVQIGSFVATRSRAYKMLALAGSAQALATWGVSLILGILTLKYGLVTGRFAGQIAAFTVYVRAILGAGKHVLETPSLRGMLGVLSTHRRFPLFKVPYSLSAAFTLEFMVLAFSALGSIATAGWYALARAVVLLPGTFLSASLSRIFYREAAQFIDIERFPALCALFVRHLVRVLVLPFAFLALWGPELFGLVFGAPWREAGVFAALLAPAAFLSTLTSWQERVFEVRNRQGLALSIQLVADTLAIIGVIGSHYLGASANVLVTVYALVQVSYQITYLCLVSRLVPLPRELLREVAVWSVGLVALLFVVHLVLILAAVPERALIEGVGVLLIVLHNGRRGFRAFRAA